ncbi:helix-turn-helix transcriptional regulator, partial [Natrarchaeobius oligotrophus]|uniref:helix-turn-helix transcriptional regulator n=1 Tax=Natrarchaeobius oligotrophus TaxID=3455743 RepID=UPI001FB4CFC2
MDEEIRAVASDLTKFQLRCLATLARQDRHGIGIREVVEEYYGEEQTHGRLYPNLDQLVEKGVVEKSERDRRTNNYALTETGRR